MPAAPHGVTRQDINGPAGTFSLPSLDGSGPRSLDEFLAGRRGALVVFWSGICTHCVRYDRYFNTFVDAHPELGFVAIASRYGETRDQMIAAVRQRGLCFPILLDETGAVARAWHAQQTPRCYLVAADRTLMFRGAVDNFKSPADTEYTAYLEPAIADFLAGRPIARNETASFGCAIETVYYHLPKQL